MNTEAEICERYEAELAAIAASDRAYYLSATPTPADRADYYRRQAYLEQLRTRMSVELSMVRGWENENPGLFRVRVNDRVIGQPVVSAPQCKLGHDLNNYLGVVIGHCELLAELAPKDAAAAKHLSDILEAAHKMAAVIRASPCATSRTNWDSGASTDLATKRVAPGSLSSATWSRS